MLLNRNTVTILGVLAGVIALWFAYSITLDKAVKLNTGFIDRLCNGLSLSDENRQKIRDARREISETRNLQVLKSGH